MRSKKKRNRKNHNYKLYKNYTINKIFDYINKNELPDKDIYHKLDYIDSFERIIIIKELLDRDGYKCQNCNIKPSFFALGLDKSKRWHLDLYSDNHDMFTIDHIHPKSKGGKNNIENYQLLCKVCNEDKSDNIDGEISKKDLYKDNYIYRKVDSLSEQIRGILTKLKEKEIICVKNINNFTIGKEYEIIDIKLFTDKNFKTKVKIVTKNDKEDIVKTTINNFLTKTDYTKNNNNKNG